MPGRILPTTFALALAAVPAWSRFPLGPEFQVNGYTTGNQQNASVAAAVKRFSPVADAIFADGFESGTATYLHRALSGVRVVLTLSNIWRYAALSGVDVPLQGGGAGNTLVGN